MSGNLNQQISANAVIASRPPTAQASGTGEQGPVTRRLRKFLDLTPEDRLLLLKLWFLLPSSPRCSGYWIIREPCASSPDGCRPSLTSNSRQTESPRLTEAPSTSLPPGRGRPGGGSKLAFRTNACDVPQPSPPYPQLPLSGGRTSGGRARRCGSDWTRHAVPDAAMSYALRLGRLARIAGRYVPANGSCLRQSLLVWWLLRRKGLPAELRIGVQKQEGFAAHAWVELARQPVNDAPDVAERFAPFDGSLSARLVSSP